MNATSTATPRGVPLVREHGGEIVPTPPCDSAEHCSPSPIGCLNPRIIHTQCFIRRKMTGGPCYPLNDAVGSSSSPLIIDAVIFESGPDTFQP